MGHPPLYITFSICPSVAHHISGTLYHLIMIFGTRVKWWYPAGVFFHFLKILIFWAVRGGGTWGKRAKNGLKLQQNLSGVLHISGTMHHMTVICGTFVVLYLQMFFFSFFQNFDFFGGTCSYIRQFLAILWTFELLLHFDKLFSSN